MSDVPVLAAGDVPDDLPPGDDVAELTRDEIADKPVGPQSPLEALRGRRGDLERTLFKDLQIPRWDSVLGRALWARFGPADLQLLNRQLDKRKESYDKAVKAMKTGDPDWLAKANADMLVDACIAVYDLAIDEEPSQVLPPNLPSFSSRELSEALDYVDGTGQKHECPRSALGTCMFLYGTTSDLLVASQQLTVWSGQASREADEAFLGT
jgi:hypothetical protein